MEGLKKIDIKPLKGVENWSEWKMSIEDILTIADVTDAIEESFVKPSLEAQSDAAAIAEHNKKLAKYQKKAAIARHCLRSTLSEEILFKVSACISPYEIWKKLLSIYEQKTSSRVYRLLTKLVTLRKSDEEDVTTHAARVQSTWMELQTASQQEKKVVLPDFLLNFMLVNSLPQERYIDFLDLWDTQPEEKQTYDRLVEMLVTREQREQQAESSGVHGLVASTVQRQQAKKLSASRSNNFGGKKTASMPKPDDVCRVCQMKGHWARTCPGKKEGKKTNLVSNLAIAAEFEQAMAVSDDLAMTPQSNKGAKPWYIDSGASVHFISSPCMFQSYQAFSEPKSVTVGNGISHAVGMGTVEIVVHCDGQTHNWIMQMWFAPEFCANLISIGMILNKFIDMCQLGDSKQWGMYKKNKHGFPMGKRYLAGKMVNSMCEMSDFEVKMPAVMINHEQALLSQQRESLRMWHKTFAHLNKKDLLQLMRNERVNIQDIDDDCGDCEGCLKGKFHRVSFGRRIKDVTAPGDRVHADVCGPIEPVARGGSRFFAVFKDEFSNYRQVYLMKSKDQLVGNLTTFIARAKALQHVIKELQTDGGGEFDNQKVRKLVSAEGIEHRIVMPYTPQQNGFVERENRTVQEAARSMLHGSGLPEFLWDEAVVTAAYILNRAAPSPIKGKQPLELWTGKRHRVQHIRPFGTSCFVLDDRTQRRKMQAKGIEGRLVGYVGDDGYRVWLPSKHTVWMSKHVKFLTGPLIENEEEQAEVVPEVHTLDIPIEVIDKTVNQGQAEKVVVEPDPDDLKNEVNIQEEDLADPVPEDDPVRNLRPRENLKAPEKLNLVAVAMMAAFPEPKTVKEAMQSENADEWKLAMQEEINSLIENQVFQLVQMQSGKRLLPAKWVLKLKLAEDGSVSRFKARLVALGCRQRIDEFGETFSPVAKADTFRFIMQMASQYHMRISQFDVRTAFLNGDLHEEVYMRQPEGFDDRSGRVWLLKKSLYGLKQAPRCWNVKINQKLTEMGFKRSQADPCLYIREEDMTLLLLYVDDGLILGREQTKIDEVLTALKTEFQITLGDVTSYLGVQIQRGADGAVFLHQSAYLERVLQDSQMENCNPVRLPGANHREDDKTPRLEEEMKKKYQKVVGKLMYAACYTRPDLAYSVNQASKKVTDPTKRDWRDVMQILKYVRGSYDLGLFYKVGQKDELVPYSDADYAGDKTDRKSTSGVVCMIGGAAVTWASRKQQCVAQSTAEAELIAAGETAKDVVWLQKLLFDTKRQDEMMKPSLKIDNIGCIDLIQSELINRRTKHIEVRFFWIRDLVAEGRLDIEHVSTENQLADIMTKRIDSVALFESLRSRIGICSLKKKTNNKK